MGQFGVGQSVTRLEDQRLLTGGGRYTDDFHLEGQAYSVVVRSPHAHADIKEIDTAEASEMPGVLAVLTAEELSKEGVNDIPCLAAIPGKDGNPPVMPGHPVLARGRVRHVGDPVAFVVAETLAQARDAAEAVVVEYEDLPAVVDSEEALKDGAPQIWDEAEHNVVLDWEIGDRAATEEAFSKAERIVGLDLVNNRLVVNSMEPRVALGDYDAHAGRYELITSTQGSHNLRNQIAEKVLGVGKDKVHVTTPDVGGGFGMKIFLYAEQVLVLVAARMLGRPVRWVSDRSEAFLTDNQGRDHLSHAEMALDADNNILGLRVSTVAGLGAYLSNFAPYIPTAAGAKMLSGLYRIPAIYCEVKCVFTNTVPVDAYRGAGRPEAAYLVERLMDYVAGEVGMSPQDFRRRNFIRPEDLPYDTGLGVTYDSGEFQHIMETAMKNIDWDGAASRKEQSRKAGKLRGLGLACYVEACAGIGEEEAKLEVTPEGDVELAVGTQSNGQGHHTAYAQILTDKLGMPIESVRLRQGDSDEIAKAGGTGGSRSLLMGGQATTAAADLLVEKARKIAGFILETAEADIEFEEGVFSVVGTDKRVSLVDVAKAAHERDDLPDDLQGPLAADGAYKAEAMTFPNGCHACELEVDADTGEVDILRYVVVDDFGRLVNPLLVAGQIHGGTAQGLGQALLEHTVYDDQSGQLLSGSFMDYCLPRADDMPKIELSFENFPCTTNPMGVKGSGEAGAIGAPPAIVNALVDALKPLGVSHIDMPATTERIWRTMQQAGHGGRQAAE